MPTKNKLEVIYQIVPKSPWLQPWGAVKHDNEVAYTLDATSQFIRYIDKTEYSIQDIRNISSFPQDYDFGSSDPQFICGMSVPPNMMANIANQIWLQWLNK